MDMSPAVVSRSELYELVWSKPMIKLAATYRITGTGMAKICHKASIPVPPRGYWNKRQAGKSVIKRPPLPPGPEGPGQRISIQPSSPSTGDDADLAQRAAVEQLSENRIKVSDQLDRPHPLIQGAIASRSKARAGRPCGGEARVGVAAADSFLDIDVSAASRDRALRLLDALFKALEARGFPVNAKGITIEGEVLHLGIVEKQDRTLHVPTPAELAEKRRYSWTRIPNWDYAPNGRLSIFTNAYVWWRKDLRKRWSDGRTARLEDMLNDVLVGLLALGHAQHQRSEELRREAEERAERERQRQERERQARMEAARRKSLAESSDAWIKADSMRRFLAEVERRIRHGDADAPAEFEAWLRWAKSVADDIDPLTDGLTGLLRRQEKAAADAAPEPKPSYGFPRL